MTQYANYHGATEGELRSNTLSKKTIGFFAQQSIFPHHGQLRLEADRLVLESWQELPRIAIISISLEFTDDYSRLRAAGVRGKSSSFGWIGNLGKPLIIRRDNSDPIYLLIDYNWLLGTTSDAFWMKQLQNWLSIGQT